jgi:uncharacterized protein
VDESHQTVIACRVQKAATLRERLFGLIGRKELAAGEGLWLEPCNGVHTIGMRFAIDLLVLDSEGRVLRIVTRLKPWRVSVPVKGAQSVVELAAGVLESTSLRPGDIIRCERVRA